MKCKRRNATEQTKKGESRLRKVIKKFFALHLEISESEDARSNERANEEAKGKGQREQSRTGSPSIHLLLVGNLFSRNAYFRCFFGVFRLQGGEARVMLQR